MKGPERKSMRWCGKEKKDESLKSICKREKSIDNIIPGAFRGFLYDKTLSHGEGPSEIYIWILTPASGIIECKLTRLHRRKAGKSNEEQSDKRGSSGASEDI